MSETLKKLNVDAALREWPSIENPATDWEDNARAIEDRLRLYDRARSQASVIDENLWAAPLGQSAEDGHNSASPRQAAEVRPMTMPADRSNDRRSLQDLAKMAQLTPPPPSSAAAPSSVPGAAKKDDSGIIDLAAASMADPSAETRAQSTPLASQGLFDEDNSVRPPAIGQAPISQAPISKAPISQAPTSKAPISQAPIAAQSAPSLPPVSAAPASIPAPALVQAREEKKGSGGKVIALVLGGVVALSAAAAGTFFVMKQRTVTPPTVTMTTAPAVLPPAPPPAATTATAAAEPAPETAPEPDLANNKVALAAKPAAKGAAPAAAKHEAPKGEAKPEASKLTEKDLAAQNNGPAGALGDEMRKAVGANDQPTPAAAATGANAATGNVPQKPSQGAVTGAVGAVLPSARSCVTADAPISRATIVFASSGTVQSVSVSGGAVGTPAEACIKSALMNAKIQPFAEPTYSAPVTIRHN